MLTAARYFTTTLGNSGFLSGAFVGVLLTVFISGLRARREKRIAALEEQLGGSMAQ